MSGNTGPAPDTATGFFAGLPRLANPDDTFDESNYRRAPDDWAVAVTDIVGSTAAIAEGNHKTVNFVAAMAIAALKNLCAPEPIPFLFGGDGAVVMVPPRHVDAARRELARVRGLAAREFGIRLRVGLAAVAELRRHGGEVLVGRYEPSPGNSFGVFLGGGVTQLERAVRGDGAPALIAAAMVNESLDDEAPTDLTGLSCSWDELRSHHGRMVTLIVHGASHLREVYTNVMRLAGQRGDPRPARRDTLRARWPPKGLMIEARARRRGGLLAVSVLRVLAETLFARIVLARGRPIGDFDPDRYLSEITSNTDFCRYDDTLCFVVDCPLESVDAIRNYVDDYVGSRGARCGIDIADTALMTCLVSSAAAGLHVHFVDGGGGGYTNAAKRMKAAPSGDTVTSAAG
jgi:hypothetical protein